MPSAVSRVWWPGPSRRSAMCTYVCARTRERGGVFAGRVRQPLGRARSPRAARRIHVQLAGLGPGLNPGIFVRRRQQLLVAHETGGSASASACPLFDRAVASCHDPFRSVDHSHAEPSGSQCGTLCSNCTHAVVGFAVQTCFVPPVVRDPPREHECFHLPVDRARPASTARSPDHTALTRYGYASRSQVHPDGLATPDGNEREPARLAFFGFRRAGTATRVTPFCGLRRIENAHRLHTLDVGLLRRDPPDRPATTSSLRRRRISSCAMNSASPLDTVSEAECGELRACTPAVDVDHVQLVARGRTTLCGRPARTAHRAGSHPRRSTPSPSHSRAR